MVMSRRLRALAPIALAALALTACWPIPGGNADRTAHNPFETAFTPATVASLEPAWSAELGPGAAGPVVVDGGGVFVRVGQEVSRLDLRTGSLRWTWTLPEEVPEEWASVSEPLVVGGRVLVGYGFGNLGGHWEGAALDPATGEPTSDPAATGLLQTARGPLVLDENFGFGSLTAITVSYGLTDVATGTSAGGGTLAAVEFGESSESGRFTLGSSTVYHVGTGILTDGDAYTQGVGVRAFALDAPSTCGPPVAPFFECPTWTIPLTGVTTHPVLGPGEEVVYIGRSDGTVVALDAATGGVLWTTPVGAPVTSTPALADGLLYVPTADGDLVAVDAGGCGDVTCVPLWSAAVDGTALTGQPAVAGTGDDAVVFVGTQGGTLAAMAAVGCGAPSCGAPLWQTSLGAATHSPAISGGRVIVGTSTGRVAAFRTPTS
jgi:outer membrane protein assembly factor BamB